MTQTDTRARSTSHRPGSFAARVRDLVSRGSTPAAVFPGIAIIAIILILPVIALATNSFWDPDFSFENYAELFADSTSLAIIARTLWTSVFVTVITLLLAYPYAAAMCIVGPKLRGVLLVIVLLPFWTSLMARTFAWLVLLQDRGPVNAMLNAIGLPTLHLVGNATGVTLGMTQVLLPFMVLPLYSVMSQIDGRLMQAAKSLGAKPAAAFFRVYLPLSKPGVYAGVMLVFIMALGFYVTPAVLGSPKEAMISQLIDIKISRLLDFGGGGALAVVIIVITVILLLVMSRFVSLTQAIGGSMGGKK